MERANATSSTTRTRRNAIHHTLQFAVVVLSVAAILGCDSAHVNEPTAGASTSPLMIPLAGKWMFDFEKTLDAQKSVGLTEEQIAQIRRIYEGHATLCKVHLDIEFDGNVAVGTDRPGSEYRFFDMHRHGSILCGKAWHHEDRYDPGDMSKCHVRLEVADNILRMEVHMEDGLPDLNDPDLMSEPPIESDAAKCEVESKIGSAPGTWAVYVFTRQQ